MYKHIDWERDTVYNYKEGQPVNRKLKQITQYVTKVKN